MMSDPLQSGDRKLGWWNWQTRALEVRMPKGVGVRVPPRAPFFKQNGMKPET